MCVLSLAYLKRRTGQNKGVFLKTLKSDRFSVKCDRTTREKPMSGSTKVLVEIKCNRTYLVNLRRLI